MNIDAAIETNLRNIVIELEKLVAIGERICQEQEKQSPEVRSAVVRSLREGMRLTESAERLFDCLELKSYSTSRDGCFFSHVTLAIPPYEKGIHKDDLQELRDCFKGRYGQDATLKIVLYPGEEWKEYLLDE